jgi:hypothetical protein
VSISYLFEATKLNYQTSSQLGITNSCNLKFDRLLGQCQAKTEEMKKFHKRAYGKFENEFKKISYDVFTIGQKKEFLEAFKKSNSLTSNPVFARVHQWCRENKKNCKSLNEKQFAEILNKFCLSDAVVMNRVCSEDDNFYGISSSNIVTELIEKSNAFGIINEQGAGQECLRRYKNLFKLKENQYADLVKMFPYIYAHLIETKGRYLQGDLFVPGSLREFDQKGLSDFLIALTPPKKEVKPVVIAKPKPEPKPIPVVKEEKVEVAVVEEPKKVEPEVVKLSEFEPKVELLKRYIDEVKLGEVTNFGNSSLTIRFNKITPRWILQDRYGIPTVKNLTPELLTIGHSSDVYGDANLRTQWRELSQKGIVHSLFMTFMFNPNLKKS